jgi:hypothetical protein
MKGNPFSTQALVRGALKSAEHALRICEIRDRVGLAGEEGYARVSRALGSLRKAREVERIDAGRYRYAGERPDGEYCRKQRVMQRIMWMRSRNGNTFTARKIAELAGCSLYVAQRYIAYLSEKGVLRRAGKVRVSPAAYAPVYIGDGDWLKSDEWPFLRTPGRTQELDACLNEMRELATRFFAVDELSEQSLSNLTAAALRLGELVGQCRGFKRNLRKTEEEAQQ